MSDKEQREKLVELLCYNACPLNEFTGCAGCGYMEVEDCRASAMADYLLANGVTIREKGEWLGEGDGYADGEIVYDVWYCSECDHCIDDGTDDPALLPNFCPNCGADMRGKGDINK